MVRWRFTAVFDIDFTSTIGQIQFSTVGVKFKSYICLTQQLLLKRKHFPAWKVGSGPRFLRWRLTEGDVPTKIGPSNYQCAGEGKLLFSLEVRFGQSEDITIGQLFYNDWSTFL